jgi:putative transposase
LHYHPVGEKPENLEMMRKMDAEFLEHPTKGVEGMVDFLVLLGFIAGPKRIRRLLRKMGVMAIYPQRNPSKLGLARYIHPYKLRKLEFTHSNQV